MKAVILAGGMGERLRPITNVLPKALTPIDGIPIIKRQIDLMIDLGIRDFLVLTGYRSQMLHDYLGQVFQGTKISVECIASPKEFSPAQRLIHSSSRLAGDILLIYCDNLVYDAEALNSILISKKVLTFLAEARAIGNLSLSPRVEYKSLRTQSSPFVELGFMKIDGSILLKYLSMTTSLQNAIEQITANHECDVVVTSKELISVSNMQRFNSFRKMRKTILIDRDGILNQKMPHREYLSNFKDYKLIEQNIESLSLRFSHSTDFIIITNQPGVSTKQVSPEFLDSVHSKLIVELLLRKISIIGLYVCIHHWDDNCDCRKPKPGMIYQALVEYKLDPKSIVYIGDEQKDLEAARNAGILGVRICEEEGESNFRSLDDSFNYIQTHISWADKDRSTNELD